MALIKCPECGREISSKSKMCIHCGYPMDDYEEIIPEEYETYEPPLITQKFQVIMTSYGFVKNRIAEELEDMKISPLDSAIDLLNNLPACIYETYSQDEARKIKSSLSDIGADITVKRVSCQEKVKLPTTDTNLYCIQILDNKSLPSDISEIRLLNRTSSGIHYIDLLITGVTLEIAKLLYNFLTQKNISCKLLKDSISQNENTQIDYSGAL